MKKLFYPFFLLILFAQIAFSQDVKGDWTPWTGLKLGQTTVPDVEVSYNLTTCNQYGIVGYSYYRFKSNFTQRHGIFSFKFDYIECDGSKKTTTVFVNVNTPGIQQSAGFYFFGIKLTNPGYDFKYNDPDKKPADDATPKSDDTKQQVTATITQARPIAIAVNSTPVVNAASSNANSQQTQGYINQAQNPNNDAIQNTLALSQAKLNAMKQGGATAAQQQQIQQVQQQQNAQSAQAVEDVKTYAGQIATGLSSYFGRKAEQKRKLKEQNAQSEADNSRQVAISLEEDKIKRIQEINAGADAGNTEDMVSKGLEYGVAGDNKNEFYWYQKAASLKNAKAMASLFPLYLNGYGVEKSEPLAFYWLQLSVNNGNVYESSRALSAAYNPYASCEYNLKFLNL